MSNEPYYPPKEGYSPNQNNYQQQGYAPEYGKQQPYAMQETPQYAPPQQPPQDYKNEPIANGYGSEAKLDDQKPHWNDLIFAVLFIAQLCGFIALSVICLRSLDNSSSGGNLQASGGSSVTANIYTAYMFAFVAVVGLVGAILMLAIVRAFTKIILEISLLFSVVSSVAFAVYQWVVGYWSGAIIFTIFAVISVISYFPMRRRIPLSRQLLLFVFRIAKSHRSVYVLALIGAILQMAWSIYWSFTMVAIYQKFTPGAEGNSSSGGSPSHAKVIGLCVYGAFSYYWTSQFNVNYFLTIEAGIYGTYYFSGPNTKKTARGAIRRASTYSLGSISFGSLIVALLDMLKAALNVLKNYESEEGNMVGYIFVCIADCCLGCIQWAVEYFNRYGMIEIALYGKPYIKACSDVWRLFKDRGIDALINDCLVNNIWTMLSYVVGAITAAFMFIYLKVGDPSYIQNNTNLKAALMGYAFAMGFFISHTLGYGAISSGVSTIFVGLAEDPQVLAERDPELFELIRNTYPKVVTSV